METFVLSILIVCLAVLGMAAGVLLGRNPLSAGCGGNGRALGAGIGCGACGVEGNDGKHRVRKTEPLQEPRSPPALF